MLETLNIWVDVIGFVVAAGMLFGFIVPHIIGSVITGRVKKHFVDDYWDPLAHRMHDPHNYHYKQPLGPDFKPPVRVWHWINIVSFVILLISGLYIRYPWFEGGREIMRMLHYFFMYIITVNLIFRLVYLYIQGDWGDYLKFDLDDIKQAPSIIKYYMFIGPPYEHKKKFNALQRPTYPAIWALLGLQAISGFIIWNPAIGGPLVSLAGGSADLAAWMRLLHNVNMRIMVLIATIHSYLGIMEDYPVLNVFWFWKDPDLSKYEHDDHHEEQAEAFGLDDEEPASVE